MDADSYTDTSFPYCNASVMTQNRNYITLISASTELESWAPILETRKASKEQKEIFAIYSLYRMVPLKMVPLPRQTISLQNF